GATGTVESEPSTVAGGLPLPLVCAIAGAATSAARTRVPVSVRVFMIDALSFFRFGFGCVVILQTTIDAHCERRAAREDESARAFHRRGVVHRFRQLLSDPRRAAARAPQKPSRRSRVSTLNAQAR